MALAQEVRALLDFVGKLENLGIDYLVGGSVASGLHGEPRTTNDVDLSVDLHRTHVDLLVDALALGYYVDRDAARYAVDKGRSFNVIHLETVVKIDVFVVGDDIASQRALARKQRLTVAKNSTQTVFVATPEDIVARKLHWFRKGGEVSDRQWRDVVGVLKAQTRLDRDILEEAATQLDVVDLLSKAIQDAGLAES